MRYRRCCLRGEKKIGKLHILFYFICFWFFHSTRLYAIDSWISFKKVFLIILHALEKNICYNYNIVLLNFNNIIIIVVMDNTSDYILLKLYYKYYL